MARDLSLNEDASLALSRKTTYKENNLSRLSTIYRKETGVEGGVPSRATTIKRSTTNHGPTTVMLKELDTDSPRHGETILLRDAERQAAIKGEPTIKHTMQDEAPKIVVSNTIEDTQKLPSLQRVITFDDVSQKSSSKPSIHLEEPENGERTPQSKSKRESSVNSQKSLDTSLLTPKHKSMNNSLRASKSNFNNSNLKAISKNAIIVEQPEEED